MVPGLFARASANVPNAVRLDDVGAVANSPILADARRGVGDIMQIDRSPRRIHGRAFLTEILIIVIGVLIALAAGQLVEDWNWRRKVAQGDLQLRREARLNFLYAAEQVAAKPCLQAQLRTLRDRVLSSGATLQPASVHQDDSMSGFVFRTPSRPYRRGVWQALMDDGTTSHMEDDRREILGSAYGAIDILNHLADETDLMTGRLMVLSHALPLDAGTRATLIASLDEQQTRSEKAVAWHGTSSMVERRRPR